MYVGSIKWQYRTWLEEQYSSEYSQSSTPSKPIMEIWLASQVKELKYRLDICRATTGAHIEVYGRA